MDSCMPIVNYLFERILRLTLDKRVHLSDQHVVFSFRKKKDGNELRLKSHVELNTEIKFDKEFDVPNDFRGNLIETLMQIVADFILALSVIGDFRGARFFINCVLPDDYIITDDPEIIKGRCDNFADHMAKVRWSTWTDFDPAAKMILLEMKYDPPPC